MRHHNNKIKKKKKKIYIYTKNIYHERKTKIGHEQKKFHEQKKKI